MELNIPRKYRRPEFLTLSIILGILLVIEAGVRLGIVSPLIITPPTEIFSSLIAQVQMETVQSHIGATIFRIIVSFILTVLIGGTCSIILWQRKTLRRAYLPLLGALFGTPIILLYLVFVAVFGRGSGAIIAISVLPGSIPLIINATDALASVNETYIEVARDFNALRRQILAKVIIPAAAPNIFAGVRIGFTYVVISVIATEFLLVINTGLGGMISNQYFHYNTTEMYVGIALVVVIVMVFIFVFDQVEEWIQR